MEEGRRDGDDASVALLCRLRETRPRDVAGPPFERIDEFTRRVQRPREAGLPLRWRVDFEEVERGYRAVAEALAPGASAERKGDPRDASAALAQVARWLEVPSPPSLALHQLLELHALVARDLDEADAGRFRVYPMTFDRSSYLPPRPSEVPSLVDELLAHVAENKQGCSPAELGIQFQVWFYAIHPFNDGNGRVARLAMTYVLGREGWPPLLVRGEQRRAYYRLFDAAFTASTRNALGPCYGSLARLYLESLAHWFGPEAQGRG